MASVDEGVLVEPKAVMEDRADGLEESQKDSGALDLGKTSAGNEEGAGASLPSVDPNGAANHNLSAASDDGSLPPAAETTEEESGAGALNGLQQAIGNVSNGADAMRGANGTAGFEPAEAPAGAANEPLPQGDGNEARGHSEGKGILGVPRGVLGMAPPVVGKDDMPVEGAQVKERIERQFFLVRIPRPDLSDIMSEIRQAEIKEQEKRKNLQFITAAINLKKSARGEAVKLRQEHRSKSLAISSEIHNKHTQMQPMRDRMKEIREAESDARSAERSFPVRTVAGLNQRLADIEYRMSHESIPLQEEKKLLRELQVLERSRKDVEALEANSTSVGALSPHREGLKNQLEPLKAEVAALKQQGDAERSIANSFHAEVEAFDKEITALLGEREAAFKAQEAAYKKLQALRNQIKEREDGYWQNRRDLTEFHRLAAAKDFAALEVFSTSQVENFHAKWADATFRSSYVKANEGSTIRRFQSLDTRRLGVDENPAELIAGASHDARGNKTGSSFGAPASGPPLANGDSKAPKTDANTGSKTGAASVTPSTKLTKSVPSKSDTSAKPSAKLGESDDAENGGEATESASQKKKADRSGGLMNGIASAAAAVGGIVAKGTKDAAGATESAVDPRKAEAAKKKAEEDEAAAVEAKKKAREEAMAKAKEAEERKRKAAERAAQKAELKAAKDAEEAAKKREKEKLRRERKKAAAASVVPDADDSPAARSATESGGDDEGQLARDDSSSDPTLDSSKDAIDESGLTSRQRKRNSAKTRKTGGMEVGSGNVPTTKLLSKKGRGGRQQQQGGLLGLSLYTWLTIALFLVVVIGGAVFYVISSPEPSFS
eukprot:TRINITY_DN15035_c0_g1_i1.p1 TRINITY_DN15035_c0_g1~~TRINITY_DN15035_c0_g1_i1.p1  ORF type:complete len:836 (-),score=257.16 TRINITY_DN15035_c0_g1_i1:1284-3791(-)